MVRQEVKDLFPFDKPLGKQYEIIEAIIKSLENGYDNVILDAPTGSGKTAINTTVLKYFDGGFYTTPQKKLRKQLENDEVLKSEYVTLRGREDYHCKVTNDDCKSCSINQDDEQSCSKQADCTYWNAKMAAFNADIASVTFSYLIIDSMLPVYAGETQISFDDRNMIVADEAHDIVDRVSNMHANIELSPYNMPESVYQVVLDLPREIEVSSEIEDEIKEMKQKAIVELSNADMQSMSPVEKWCQQFVQKSNYLLGQLKNGKEWVVDTEQVRYGKDYMRKLDLYPIDVSSYLRNNVWNRANKRIISTATMRYQDDPNTWIRNIGLDPDNTMVISTGMRFPKENRPIHTDTMVCSMSGGGDDDNWQDIMEKMNEIAKYHHGQKGLAHTVSYSRAERIHDDAQLYTYLDDNTYLHERDKDDDKQIQEWQKSNKDIFLSPSSMEGLDLKGDKARYQILVKVPYPPRNNKRYQYMLDEIPGKGWKEYYETTMNRIVQSYGRAVRSETDTADYYILDEDFKKVKKRAKPPDWFSEALEVEGRVGSKSIYDY